MGYDNDSFSLLPQAHALGPVIGVTYAASAAGLRGG